MSHFWFTPLGSDSVDPRWVTARVPSIIELRGFSLRCTWPWTGNLLSHRHKMASQPNLHRQRDPDTPQCHPTSTVVLAVEQTTFSLSALPLSSSSSSLPHSVLCSPSWPSARPGFTFQSLFSSQFILFPSTNSSELDVP